MTVVVVAITDGISVDTTEELVVVVIVKGILVDTVEELMVVVVTGVTVVLGDV